MKLKLWNTNNISDRRCSYVKSYVLTIRLYFSLSKAQLRLPRLLTQYIYCVLVFKGKMTKMEEQWREWWMNDVMIKCECSDYSMESHLDSEGPSLPLWIQTLVSKTQQDLETRQRTTVESITLDLWGSGGRWDWIAVLALMSKIHTNWCHSNEFRRISSEVMWPLGRIEWKVLVTPCMQIKMAAWLLHSWSSLSMWAGVMWLWRSHVTVASPWITTLKRFSSKVIRWLSRGFISLEFCS